MGRELKISCHERLPVDRGEFWGQDRYVPGAPEGTIPPAIAFGLAAVNDPLTRLIPDAVRRYAD